MKHMSQADWDEYIKVMNDWQEDMFQQSITWIRTFSNVDIEGEGDNQRIVEVPLKCLVQYNYFRAWPIDKPTPIGELDKQTCLVFFNIKYLKDLGFTDENDQFIFDPGHDRFILNGVEYEPTGDSQAAQAHDKPLFIFIILKREELSTSEDRYGQ